MQVWQRILRYMAYSGGAVNKICLSQRQSNVLIVISQCTRSTRALQQRVLYRGIVSLPAIGSIPLDAITPVQA